MSMIEKSKRKGILYMHTQNLKTTSTMSVQSDRDDSLLSYIEVIIKYRKMICYVVGTTSILSMIVALVWPNMYKATARVLPPRVTSSGISALFSNGDDSLTGLAGNLLRSPTPASQYVGIMRSRTVVEALNQKFDLENIYGCKYIEDVAEKLKQRSTIAISKKDQIIIVSVIDRDPQRAADMANAYIDMLDQINRKLNITQGKRKRLFLESRVKKVHGDLNMAEMELKSFQEKYHLVSIAEQAKVALEGAAEIKGMIIAAETELEVFKQFGTERQIEAVMLKAKIEELHKHLNTIEQGEKSETNSYDDPGMNKDSNFYIPIDQLPRLGMQLMRLTREAKLLEKLFELLTAQYEMAQIEEAKDVNTIQILDSAIPPERKHSPKIFVIVFSSMIVSALFAVLLSFILEYYSASKLAEKTNAQI
jgi:uncharacterized protein involved in exopolysaccharide biosynthesis